MEYTGLLNMCKLPGMSSHEVVSRVRRIIGMKRVGHTGTLDPVACGVLPICLGPATRLADYISNTPKTYRAEFLFGLATDSGDAEGDVVARADASELREEEVYTAMRHFTGTFLQRPPRHSAVWIDGERAYDIALRGEEVEMPLREVTVHDFSPVRFVPGERARLLADITCSRGTYIRSLAIDLGVALGTGGVLCFLARTAVSSCLLEDAITLEELAAAVQADQLDETIHSPDVALMHLPEFHLFPSKSAYRQGTVVRVNGKPGLYRVYLQERFVGLGRLQEGTLQPVVNL